MQQLTTIGHAEAQRAIEVISTEVARRGKAAVIAAVDVYGELIAFLRMDGGSLASIRIAQHKAYTAAREGRPSKDIGDRVSDPVKGHDIAYFGDDRYIGWGGGLPVLINGRGAGAIAVSGLPEAEDIEVCGMGIAAIHAMVEDNG
jgi:glc operon protein GlcG